MSYFKTSNSFFVFCILLFICIQICVFFLTYLLIQTSRHFNKEQSQMRFTVFNNIASIFSLANSRILLQIVASLFAYSVRNIWFQESLPSFQNITSFLLTTTTNQYVCFALLLFAFVELLLCSTAQILFGHDFSICRKAVWSNNSYFGQLLEALIEIYIQADFILNSSVILIIA